MIIDRGTLFKAVQTDDFEDVTDEHAFCDAHMANLMLEPSGRMPMPSFQVMTRPGRDYRVHRTDFLWRGKRFPPFTNFPRMKLTVLQNAYCLPFGPPILADRLKIINDYLIPWAPDVIGWFNRYEDNVYATKVSINTDQTEYEIDTAFYMDHSISGHFGHFIGDCLPRLHALETCRAMFGDIKVIIASRAKIDVHTHFLNAAGIPSQDIVRINSLVRCRRLLLATNSLGVEHYASPRSAQLWDTIRDRTTGRDVTMPDKIYLSRSNIKVRGLANESAVESMFERYGFTIIHPESMPIERQIALMANALYIAGTSGSGMFNLAFQGRMRSAFIIVWEQFIQMSEMLLSVGRDIEIRYHVGESLTADEPRREGASWKVDLARLESEVGDWMSAG